MIKYFCDKCKKEIDQNYISHCESKISIFRYNLCQTCRQHIYAFISGKTEEKEIVKFVTYDPERSDRMTLFDHLLDLYCYSHYASFEKAKSEIKLSNFSNLAKIKIAKVTYTVETDYQEQQ